MVRSALRTIARLLAPWRTIRRLELNNKRLERIIENPTLAGLKIGRETGLTCGMRGSGPQLLAGMFLGLMQTHGKDAPNYMELTFGSSMGRILVTVTQPGGATPHQLRAQAEQRVRQLEAELRAARCAPPAPAPPADGDVGDIRALAEPQPSADGQVAELVAWLLHKAMQAADNDSPVAAGMLTLAAQIASEHSELLEGLADGKSKARVALAQPPAAGEVAELVAQLRSRHFGPGALDLAADLLEHLALLQPIPVAERLPVARDCDADRRCWQEEPGTATEPPAWNLVHRMRVIERAPNGRWLPAHVLPLPSGEVEA